MADSRKALRIGAIHTSHVGGESRVEAVVDGVPLWFASPDADFRVASEGFLCSMLLPAMAAGRRLSASDAVCPLWLENIGRAIEVCQKMWRLNPIQVDAPRLTTTPPASSLELAPSAGASSRSTSRTALAFSGGVDSLYSLLRYPHPIESLVYIEDYDMPRNGRSWPGRFDGWLRDIGRDTGKRTILVRTNLKRHPSFPNNLWYAAHGACIAAVGHLLADHFDTLLLSSSITRTATEACGTHWSLDPLWSSASLQVESFGEPYRPQKLRDIAGHPLAQRYLRCCWEGLNDRMNCGECEKCLRTELALAGANQLSAFDVFNHPVPLADRVAGLRCIRSVELFPAYQQMLDGGLPTAINSAVVKLLERSRRLARWRHFRKQVFQRWLNLRQSLPSLVGQRSRAAG